METKTDGLSWVERLRSQFPVAERTAYLDAAYDTGGALFMRRAAEWFFDQWPRAAAEMQRGGPGRQCFFDMQDRVRRDIGLLLGGVSAEHICFTKNTNEGVNALLLGFDYRPGDNIVLFENDFPSLVAPAIQAARLRGVECRLVKPSRPYVHAVEDLIEQIDNHTRIVAVSHVQSSTGYRADLGKLGRVCRQKGIFLIADATQSVGIAPLAPEDWGVSALSAASYKGMMGGISSAFLYACPELMERVEPIFVSYGDCVNPVVQDGVGKIEITRPAAARKLESGTVDALGVCVMGSGIRTILDIGQEEIWRHISKLYELLYDGLAALGYPIITPRDPAHRSSILAVDAGDDKVRLYAHFQQNGVALSASRYLRFGIPAFALERDIYAALDAAGSAGKGAGSVPS